MRNTQRINRRNIIIFLFTLVIFMFGGFYYFSSEINIKGVGGSNGSFKVLITDVSLKEVSGQSSDKSKVPSFSNDTIEFSPFLSSPNESLVYTITVENQGALDAKYRFVPKLDDNSPGVKFKIGEAGEWNILKSGEKNELDIVIYYDNEYASKSTVNFSNLMLSLESMQNVGEVTDVKIKQPVFEEKGSSLKITYPNGCGSKYKCTYQKDTNQQVTVLKKSVEVKFPSSGTVTAKVSDDNNNVSSSHDITVNPIMMVWNSNSKGDFHSENYKEKITYVEFIDNINIPAQVKNWDISYEKNGSVIAYVVDNGQGGYKLYIGGVEGVLAKDLSYMFYGFSNLQSINLSKLDTSNAISMRSTFEDCHNLSSLDLRNFNTSNVVAMNNMFKNASNLKTIYVSNTFITTQVISSKNMFFGCNSLKGQSGMTYNQSNVDKNYALAGPNGYFSTI